jgi:hypothetical protein
VLEALATGGNRWWGPSPFAATSSTLRHFLRRAQLDSSDLDEVLPERDESPPTGAKPVGGLSITLGEGYGTMTNSWVLPAANHSSRSWFELDGTLITYVGAAGPPDASTVTSPLAQ